MQSNDNQRLHAHTKNGNCDLYLRLCASRTNRLLSLLFLYLGIWRSLRLPVKLIFIHIEMRKNDFVDLLLLACERQQKNDLNFAQLEIYSKLTDKNQTRQVIWLRDAPA